MFTWPGHQHPLDPSLHSPFALQVETRESEALVMMKGHSNEMPDLYLNSHFHGNDSLAKDIHLLFWAAGGGGGGGGAVLKFRSFVHV